MKKTFNISPVLCFCLGLLFPVGGTAQEMPVPVELQLNLLLKIVSFDRNLTSRTGDSIRVGIVYQEQFRSSLLTREQFEQEFRSLPAPSVHGLPLALIPIDILQEDLQQALESRRVDILYVSPLRAYDIWSVSEACRNQSIVSFTGVPDYCEQGLAVGIGIRRNRPEIIINLQAARAGGADFSSQLLKLARLIR